MMSPSLQNTIASTGSLQAAIAQLHNDECMELLNEALAVQSAEREAADPMVKVRTLRCAADDLDARAERLWADAADYHGKASHRTIRGDHGLADDATISARASETLAADLEARAFALRLEAAHIEGAIQRRKAFASEVLSHLGRVA